MVVYIDNFIQGFIRISVFLINNLIPISDER